MTGGRTLEGILCLAETQLAGLLEGGEGFIDAGDGLFVWLDVEVVDCVRDELLARKSYLLSADGFYE